MYISSEQHTKLANRLFDKVIEFRETGEKNIKAYETAFQSVIEEVFPDKSWWDVTECEIFMHLMEHQDPTATAIAILRGLKED